MQKTLKKWQVFFENAATFLFWGKLFFVFYILHLSHRCVLLISNSKQLTFISNFIESSQNGFFQDCSAAAYQVLFLAIPNLLVFAFSRQWQIRIFAILSTSLLMYSIFIWIADAAIYHYWGTHLNSQAIAYLSYPKQLLASVAPEWIITGTLSFLMFTIVVFKWILRKSSRNNEMFRAFNKMHLFKQLITIVFLGVLSRGGLGKIPLSITEPYKSKSEEINALSVNAFWNINYLLLNTPKHPDVDHLINHEFYNPQLVKVYKAGEGDITTNNSPTKTRPNMILIIMEGVSAQTSKLLGGTHFNGLSHLDSWVKEWGVYSQNFYATGDRTDKGLASIFSGWPGHPWQGILHDPDRFKKLPHLMGEFAQMGYQTGFQYGGDMNFANIRAYMIGGGTRNLKDKNQLKDDVQMGNWGVHDSDLLNKAYSELKQIPKPYFYSFLTLSSHEPYDIVKTKRISEIEKYYQSVAYVDRSIDAFLRKCFNDDRFDDTYFVIVSDHGKNLETPETHFGQREFFRIPFYLIGKPVKESRIRINATCFSQADLYSSLLDLCCLKHDNKAKYSRSIFRDSHPNNAVFHMHEVVGLISNENIDWITTNRALLKGEEPLSSIDSVILSLESEIISDYFD